MSTPIQTGLVGYGMSGRVFHAPFLHTLPGYAWHAVVERNRNEAAQTFENLTTLRSLDALLQLPEIELVVITSPNETHYSYAMQALEAGKHVVLEKPFATNSREARQLVEAAETAQKVLAVYHNRRYVGDFMTIAQLLQQQALGPVHEYICHFDRYRNAPKPDKAWREENRPGSGVFFDLGPHLIDQALCLFGLPQFITAFIKNQRSFAVVDDYFDVRLDYDNGCTVILKSGMLVREMGPRYAVHGTLGSYLKYGDDPQEALLKTGMLPNTTDWGKEPDANNGILHTLQHGVEIRHTIPTVPGNFGLFYTHLFDTIRNNAPLRTHPAHGYNTIRLIELAMESNSTRRTLPCTALMDFPYPV